MPSRRRSLSLLARVASFITAPPLLWRSRPVATSPFVAAPWLLALTCLAGCGSTDPYAFPPACPHAAAVPEAADVTRFRASGADLTDMVIDGRITGLTGKCSREADGRLRVEVSVSMLLTRGPAAQGRTEAVDYFVAVTEAGERILVKDPLRLQVVFPPNVDRVSVTGEPLVLSLPTSKTKTGEAFNILAGFQLTPAQLAFNRRHTAR